MTQEKLSSILKIGETVAVEFKRCGGSIENDVYESVCSMLNRFGGDIFLGVLDDGTVYGIPEQASPSLIKNFISVLGNRDLFNPTICLDPEIIHFEGKTLIHIHIPASGEVHSFKKVIYTRINDSDVKVTSTSEIAQMYIRKQEIFTERRVFPYIKMDDLRLDLLSKIRIRAHNNKGSDHPWETMTDEELLKSAGLYAEDRVSGHWGINLAGVMLLGKDEIIHEIAPMYLTDALLRKVNVDRYDDREIVDTNLIESYDFLIRFAEKHLPDKFYVENYERKSIRNIIVREMIVNMLMHREFTAGYQAKFIIEKDRMYAENANRARKDGFITPDNLEPYPKNPLIASFFRNIGYSDKLGSGVRKIFKYANLYSGKVPEFIEGDIFRIIVPLDENYSADYGIEAESIEKTVIKNEENTRNMFQGLPGNKDLLGKKTENLPGNKDLLGKKTENLPGKLEKTFKAIGSNLTATNVELAHITGQSERTIRNHCAKLKKLNLIRRIGPDKGGRWEIITTQGEI